MNKEKKKIRKKRNPKLSNVSSQPVKKLQCPVCKELVPEHLIMSIRGQIKCIKCHIEDVWCYTEQNRRTQNDMTDKLLSVDWKGKK